MVLHRTRTYAGPQGTYERALTLLKSVTVLWYSSSSQQSVHQVSGRTGANRGQEGAEVNWVFATRCRRYTR